MFRSFICLVLGLALSIGAACSAAENVLLKDLQTAGITIPPGPAVVLPPIVLADGLTEEEQRTVLEGIADKTHPLKLMMEKKRDAIYQFKVRVGGKDFPGPKSARRVDLFFFVYGDLAVISSEKFLKDQVTAGREEGSSLESLDAAALAKRKITPAEGEKYASAKFRIFDNIEVSGGARTMQTKADESMTLAISLDPRFDKDAEFPNAWHRVTFDPKTNQVQHGANAPYTGVGAFVKATKIKLKEAQGAVLIEYHLAFDEPVDWFQGRPLLSAKLGTLTGESVPRFRSQVDKAMNSSAK